MSGVTANAPGDKTVSCLVDHASGLGDAAVSRFFCSHEATFSLFRRSSSMPDQEQSVTKQYFQSARWRRKNPVRINFNYARHPPHQLGALLIQLRQGDSARWRTALDSKRAVVSLAGASSMSRARRSRSRACSLEAAFRPRAASSLLAIRSWHPWTTPALCVLIKRVLRFESRSAAFRSTLRKNAATSP